MKMHRVKVGLEREKRVRELRKSIERNGIICLIWEKIVLCFSRHFSSSHVRSVTRKAVSESRWRESTFSERIFIHLSLLIRRKSVIARTLSTAESFDSLSSKKFFLLFKQCFFCQSRSEHLENFHETCVQSGTVRLTSKDLRLYWVKNETSCLHQSIGEQSRAKKVKNPFSGAIRVNVTQKDEKIEELRSVWIKFLCSIQNKK